MKPVIIYCDKTQELKLTRKEFEKYLADAYDAGYKEGYNSGLAQRYWPYYYTSTNSGTITSNPTTAPLQYTTITCEAHNATGD